jgi:hypothetical protein
MVRAVQVGAIQQYSQVQGARGTTGWGWGFATPTQGLYDAYSATDSRRDATIIHRDMTLYDGYYVGPNTENKFYNYKAYSSNYRSGLNRCKYPLFKICRSLLIKAEAMNELGQTSAAIPFESGKKQS